MLLPLGAMLVTVILQCLMGLVVWQQLEGHQFVTRDLEGRGVKLAAHQLLQNYIMLLPLGVILVTVNLAMPHGTCSMAKAGGPPV
ncbi:unnamed protein product [Staurois parvus]|uniref:Uncharacterized protein n=1 Tax=Staurois parvus TaxID=386267 RepID=A0ABN9BKN2_9NEOB|nr:unnamed protein product [Staurois parvus]